MVLCLSAGWNDWCQWDMPDHDVVIERKVAKRQ